MREMMYSNEDGLASDSFSNGDTSVNLSKQTAFSTIGMYTESN